MAENEVPSRNYYNDLELRPDAGYDQIRSQYKKLSLRFHPDKNRGKEDEYNSKFLVIKEAYEILKDPTKRLTYDRQRNFEAERARRSANRSSNPHPPGPSTASQKEKPRPASGFGKAQNTPRPERPSYQPGRRPPTAGSSKSYERGSQQTGPGNGRGGFGFGPQTASPHKNPIFGAQSHRGGRKREGKRPTGSGSSPRRHPSPIRTSQPGEFDGSNPTKERPTGFDPNGSREDERMAPQGVSGYRNSEPSTLWDNQEIVHDEGTSMPEPDKPGASRKTSNEGCSLQTDDPRSAPLKRKRKLIFTDLNRKFGRIIQGEVRLEIYSDEDDEIDYPQSIGDLNP